MIFVNWGEPSASAYVRVRALGNNGCEGPARTLPVRINVQLVTETPRGPDSVCVNLTGQVPYQITATNGLVYSWYTTGGKIRSGQGTAQVVVDWPGEGVYQLWVQEKSVTVDTVCYGNSDTLTVRVFRDITEFDLSAVSVGHKEGNTMQISWPVSRAARVASSLSVYRRVRGEEAWTLAGTGPVNKGIWVDTGVVPAEHSYEYKLGVSNRCEQPLLSALHRSILLKGEVNTEDLFISLAWNAYEGWQAVDRYELYRRVDSEAEPVLVKVFDPNTTRCNLNDVLVGFTHHYQLKAISKRSDATSWSNKWTVVFTHPLFIPNVITPNGDGKNDTFQITHLELYADNELLIHNRWGQLVYRQKNYRGDWDAPGLESGMYYYSFSAPNRNVRQKGWLHVLR